MEKPLKYDTGGLICLGSEKNFNIQISPFLILEKEKKIDVDIL